MKMLKFLVVNQPIHLKKSRQRAVRKKLKLVHSATNATCFITVDKKHQNKKKKTSIPNELYRKIPLDILYIKVNYEKQKVAIALF